MNNKITKTTYLAKTWHSLNNAAHDHKLTYTKSRLLLTWHQTKGAAPGLSHRQTPP